MSKKVDFRQVSDKKCKGWHRDGKNHSCQRKLKKNLLARIPGAERCWRCHIRHLGKNPAHKIGEDKWAPVPA